MEPTSGGTYEATQRMEGLADVMRQAANRGKVLAIAFAQASASQYGKRLLDPRVTMRVRGLFNAADASIGIGGEFGGDGDGTPRSRRQTLTVRVGAADPVKVPVVANFEFCRFEDFVPKKGGGTGGGWLPFTRERFDELCAIGLSTCVNLYAFLAIKAHFAGKGAGYSWYQRTNIAVATGLSVKQIRTATRRLVEAELVTAKRRGAKSIGYTILGWARHHAEPGAGKVDGGYVRVYRSLADPACRDIFGDPPLLRLWLFLLMGARVFQDVRIWDAHPGHIVINFDDLECEVGLRRCDAEELMVKLQDRGSIELVEGCHAELVVKLVNWGAYQAEI